MCDGEGREYEENPSECVTPVHSHWNVLEAEDHDDEETTRHKVQKQSHDLRIDV